MSGEKKAREGQWGGEILIGGTCIMAEGFHAYDSSDPVSVGCEGLLPACGTRIYCTVESGSRHGSHIGGFLRDLQIPPASKLPACGTRTYCNVKSDSRHGSHIGGFLRDLRIPLANTNRAISNKEELFYETERQKTTGSKKENNMKRGIDFLLPTKWH